MLDDLTEKYISELSDIFLGYPELYDDRIDLGNGKKAMSVALKFMTQDFVHVVPFLRVGDHFFLNGLSGGHEENIFRLNRDVKNNGGHVMHLSQAESYFRSVSEGIYTMDALAAVSSVDFRGRTLIDIGAGAGVLGLFAKYLGAKKIISVEKSKSVLEIPVLTMINGLDRDDFYIIRKDITKKNPFSGRNLAASKILKLGESLSDSVCTIHIGPQTRYKDINDAAFRMLQEMPYVTTLIGAGYLVSDEYPQYAPSRELERLSSLGFTKGYKEIKGTKSSAPAAFVIHR